MRMIGVRYLKHPTYIKILNVILYPTRWSFLRNDINKAIYSLKSCKEPWKTVVQPNRRKEI